MSKVKHNPEDIELDLKVKKAKDRIREIEADSSTLVTDPTAGMTDEVPFELTRDTPIDPDTEEPE